VPDAPLRELRWATLDPADRAALLARQTGRIFDPTLREGVERIIQDVRLHGDEAIVRALREFDGCDVDAGALRVSADEIERAYDAIPDEVVRAIRQSIDHVRRYNERVLEGADWRIELEPGLMLGEKTTAIASAGLYIPSGKGSFPSVLVQVGTPAVVAGVPEIAVVVPPMPGPTGRVDPAVLVVAHELGLRNVFRANGPAGVAALAFGTETIPQVLKVLGPGSPPVAAAQIEIQRYGTVSFMILGPSESLVIADRSADVRVLAADLLNEAEHGSDSASLLVTADEELLARVQAEVATQLAALPEPRRGYAASAIGEVGGAIIVRDLDEAADFANLYAPEHLLVTTVDDEAVLAKLEHAGEILLGRWTPFSSANYTLGVPASLPTGRYARVSSGITARSFVKTASIARASQSAFEAIAPSVLALAEHEGFPAHAAAVRVRLRPDPEGPSP
jgi:histidinol dehydrogenase